MEDEKPYLQNVEEPQRVKATTLPKKSVSSDVDGVFYDNIIDAAEIGKVDISKINSFTNVSNARDQVLDLIDLMAEDPIIAAALDIYTSDACEPNESGQLIWAVSNDPHVTAVVNSILKKYNVNKFTPLWMSNLIKYGDVYLRLYRESEYERREKQTLNEDVYFNNYKKSDHYSRYAEITKNPAEVFDLYRMGKSYGFLRTHINHQKRVAGDLLNNYERQLLMYQYKFNRGDVDVYAATEYVHGCLDDDSNRVEEEVSITLDNEIVRDSDRLLTDLHFSVRRGKSVLYNSFKIWRELTLLENSVLLGRLTKSAVVRTVAVEVGDMDKDAVRALISKIKQMLEQKSALNVGQSIQEYTNPGPMENVIYVPTHEGIGNITTSTIGGDVQVGDLKDLEYWKKKLYGSLGIPGAYLGDVESTGSGFSAGTSLTLVSSRYAKTIKKIQASFISMITDLVNLVLIDTDLVDYIDRFELKMQSPSTQEEKDRRDNLTNAISVVSNVMSLLDNLNNPITKLECLKSLLSDAISNEEVVRLIQQEIDEMEKNGAEAGEGGDDFSGGDLGGGLGGGDFGGDFDSPDDILGDDDLPTPEEAAAEESFYDKEGKEALAENSLPSFDDLGISYTEAN